MGAQRRLHSMPQQAGKLTKTLYLRCRPGTLLRHVVSKSQPMRNRCKMLRWAVLLRSRPNHNVPLEMDTTKYPTDPCHPRRPHTPRIATSQPTLKTRMQILAPNELVHMTATMKLLTLQHRLMPPILLQQQTASSLALQPLLHTHTRTTTHNHHTLPQARNIKQQILLQHMPLMGRNDHHIIAHLHRLCTALDHRVLGTTATHRTARVLHRVTAAQGRRVCCRLEGKLYQGVSGRFDSRSSGVV